MWTHQPLGERLYWSTYGVGSLFIESLLHLKLFLLVRINPFGTLLASVIVDYKADTLVYNFKICFGLERSEIKDNIVWETIQSQGIWDLVWYRMGSLNLILTPHNQSLRWKSNNFWRYRKWGPQIFIHPGDLDLIFDIMKSYLNISYKTCELCLTRRPESPIL